MQKSKIFRIEKKDLVNEKCAIVPSIDLNLPAKWSQMEYYLPTAGYNEKQRFYTLRYHETYKPDR